MKIINQNKSDEKGKLIVNFPKAISEFEKAFQKFPVKKILYNRIFRGKGLEFDTYRTFESDDDSSIIDWKATLRSNETLAKKYVEERELNIYFILDVSRGMLFGSGDQLKAEYSSEMIAAIAHLILGSGDKIGLILFNEKIVKILQPSNSKNQFGLFTKILSDAQFYQGGSNIEETIKDMFKIIKAEYTILIIVSDFLNLKKDDQKNLKLLGSKYETLAIMVRDPFDESLPQVPFQLSIQDPKSKRQIILDPKITKEKYKESVIQQKALANEIFRKSQIDSLEVSTSKSFVVPLVTFFKSRAKGGRI